MIDSIFIILLIILTVKGFNLGDFKEMVGLFSIAITLVLAFIPTKAIQDDMTKAGIPQEFGFLTGYSITSIIFFPFIFLFLNYLLQDFHYSEKKNPISRRFIGMSIGLLKASLIIVLAVHILIHLPLRPIWIEDSTFIQILRP